MMREHYPNIPRMEVVDEEDLKDIILSPKISYLYSLNFIQEPFPQGETAIARSAKYSFRYAINILNKRFEKGEQVIKNSVYRQSYKEYFKLEDF